MVDSDFDNVIRVLELPLETLKIVQRVLLDDAQDAAQRRDKLLVVAAGRGVAQRYEKLVQRSAAFSETVAEVG